MNFKIKKYFIIWAYRNKKTDKLIFTDENVAKFYKRLLDIQKIKNKIIEVYGYE